jgi:hypothetical protein
MVAMEVEALRLDVQFFHNVYIFSVVLYTLCIKGTHVEHDVGTCGLTCASYVELEVETFVQTFSTCVESDDVSLSPVSFV